ncbi:MAG: aminopeptidase [Deltaproteobacteria bacterium]|nr:aminopeptidase [Deltaproteobacteria bacterium]
MRRSERWRRLAAAAAWAVALAAGGCLLAGCSPLYVLRAGYEEARILWRRQPIEELLADPLLDADTKSKLALALDARAFARDRLGLRAAGSFSSFARVDADQVVHVVLAAYRERLELVTWWFPIVGRVPYRGFFDQAEAHAAAAELEAEGYDTVVQPSVAFSTLGWFDDPLLSNLLRLDRVSLAAVIMHELTHNTRYLPGHGAFNESFANFVGYSGTVAFFTARGESDNAARAEQLWQDALAFSAFLGRLTASMRAAYASGIDDSERRRRLSRGQTEFRALPLQTNLYADFARAPLNNASLLHYAMYNERLELFAAMQARARGNLAAAIAQVLQVAAGAADPYAALAAHLGSN